MWFRRPVNFVARRLLYLWVKSEVLPSGSAQSFIDTGKPVIYVLENRSWSNLLVLEHECIKRNLPLPLSRVPSNHFAAWHSVYTTAPRLPFKAWLVKQPKRSRMLRGLLEVLHEYPEEDIQFVPVSIFWGRPVSKQRSWVMVLFADSWALAGRTRKLFTILFNGRHTLVKFSEPIYGRSFIQTGVTDDETIDHLQQIFSTKLVDIRTATLGPDVSHRRTLIRKILQVPEIQESIHKRQQEDNISEYQAALTARRYLCEIVADCTSITIQMLQRGLTAFWNKFYAGIVVNHSDALKRCALTHTLVYVPCHRSHIDYLLLSYVIHSEGLAIPYIAAGKNLNMPIIGPILRSAGAFFIRRSFKGNELYSKLMFEYVAMLLSTGMPIEYFVEGGRSRTGRLLPPKTGMLAMTIRGFLKYRKKPVAFIPVYIGYEKMIEGKVYVAELLGSKKKQESLFASIRSMLNIRGEFGKVTATFGQPVFLEQVLGENQPHWASMEYSDVERPIWLANTVSGIAQRIMTEINRACSVNATTLVSTALIASVNKHMDEKEMAALLDLYSIMLNSVHYSDQISVTQLNGQAQINHVESLGMIKRRSHPLGDIIFVSEKQAGILNYYRNNILHLFALPSLVACCFMNKQTLKRDKIHRLVSMAYPHLKSELFLVWQSDQLPAAVDPILDFLVEYRLLSKREGSDSYSTPGPGTLEYAQLMQLAKVILPVLELYYMILTLLIRNDKKNLSHVELEELCFLTAQRIALIYQQFSMDYFDKKLVSNFIASLIAQGYLVNEEGALKYKPALTKANKDARLLLSTQMRTSMLHILKPEPVI